MTNSASAPLVRGQYGAKAGIWSSEPPPRVEEGASIDWSSTTTDGTAPDGFVNYYVESTPNEWVLIWWQGDGAKAVAKNGSVPGGVPPKLAPSPDAWSSSPQCDVFLLTVTDAQAAAPDASGVHVAPGSTSASAPACVSTGLTIVLVGSPEPPSQQPYQLQFVTAAATLPMGPNTIWLIERTGYELYGVSLSFIKNYAVRYAWITPKTPVTRAFSLMPDHAISRLVAFSHGVSFDTFENNFPPHGGATAGECMVALRYGWDQVPDYGLSLDEIPSVDPAKFRQNAVIELNSCNSGTVGSRGRSVAQTLANRVGLAVWGWTGRTSYADINHGTGTKVRGSAGGLIGDRKQYFDSTMRGRTPVFQVFSPACEVTGSAAATGP